MRLPPKPTGRPPRGFAALNLSDPAITVPADWLPPLDQAPKRLLDAFARKVRLPAARLSDEERRERVEARRERRLEGSRERRRQYRAEIGSAAELQRRVVELNAALFGVQVSRGTPWSPPGLLDQHHGADNRGWRLVQASRLRRGQRVELGLSRDAYQVYAVTLARPEWILASLDPAILAKIRKEVQRQTKRLPFPYVVTGVIDVCPLRDVLSGTEGWAFHVHLTVQLVVPSFKEGIDAIRRAYPYKSKSDRGVPRGRVVKCAFDVRGWDRYQDKLFQYGGVKLRIVRIDSWSGKRRRAIKVRLLVPQQAELAIFFAKIRADDLMIWAGHRRYGDRVVRIGCNSSKSRESRSKARIRRPDPSGD